MVFMSLSVPMCVCIACVESSAVCVLRLRESMEARQRTRLSLIAAVLFVIGVSIYCQVASVTQQTTAAPPTATSTSIPLSTPADKIFQHRHWQATHLQQLLLAGTATNSILSTEPALPGVVLVKLTDAGWGNRLPSMITGLLMAVLTGRLFMIEPDGHNMAHYLEFAWDVDWSQYSHVYAMVTTCDINHNRLFRPDMAWCQNGTATVMKYTSLDYDTPLLEVNPALQETLQHYFPQGDLFHQVSTRLFKPSAAVLAALTPYDGLMRDCLVGMHIRSQKYFRGLSEPQPQPHELAEQFAGIAKAVALHDSGTVFVAADAPVFAQVSKLMPDRRVWWTNLTASSIGSSLAAGGNPGSDLSAFVDMFVLAECKRIVITSGSSFGSMAAGYSNVVPVLVVKGPHKLPYYNPWFWKALSSEPHMFKAGALERHALSQDALAALQGHARFRELEQLHP